MWIGRNVEWITHDLAVDDHYRVDVEKVENRRPIELSGVVLAKHGQWMGFQYFVDPPFEFGQVFRIRTGNAMQRPCHFGCHARARAAGRVKGIHVTKTVEHRVRVKSPTRTNCLHGGRHEEVILPVLRRPRDAELPESSIERAGRGIREISDRLPLVHTAGYVGRHEALALL